MCYDIEFSTPSLKKCLKVQHGDPDGEKLVLNSHLKINNHEPSIAYLNDMHSTHIPSCYEVSCNTPAYSIKAAPYSLQAAAYSLQTTPCRLLPASSSLLPAPSILLPALSILLPAPSRLLPAPSSLLSYVNSFVPSQATSLSEPLLAGCTLIRLYT